MCCLVLTAGFLGPRVALLAWWIFGERVDLAFDSWVWPLLGLIALPWTTRGYVLVWSAIVVGLGFLADVLTYTSRAASSRYQSSRAY
jgi:hypothetical protein